MPDGFREVCGWCEFSTEIFLSIDTFQTFSDLFMLVRQQAPWTMDALSAFQWCFSQLLHGPSRCWSRFEAAMASWKGGTSWILRRIWMDMRDTWNSMGCALAWVRSKWPGTLPWYSSGLASDLRLHWQWRPKTRVSHWNWAHHRATADFSSRIRRMEATSLMSRRLVPICGSSCKFGRAHCPASSSMLD